MKKYNEGYTLPLVLIVMIVLSLVALGVMSVSLHNLRAQQASIQRMESKYAAQGELEKAVANLSTVLALNQVLSANETGVQASEYCEAAEEVFLEALGVDDENSCVHLQKEVGEGKKPEWIENTNGMLSCTIFLYVTDPDKNVGITCSIYLENVLVPENNSSVYFYHDTEIIYTSYEIGGVA
jgi:Tfp pilus assembly protein PilX